MLATVLVVAVAAAGDSSDEWEGYLARRIALITREATALTDRGWELDEVLELAEALEHMVMDLDVPERVRWEQRVLVHRAYGGIREFRTVLDQLVRDQRRDPNYENEDLRAFALTQARQKLATAFFLPLQELANA